MPSRREIDKIERIFGVEPVDKAKLSKTVILHPPSHYRDRLAEEFEEARRAILVLRKSQNRQEPKMQRR